MYFKILKKDQDQDLSKLYSVYHPVLCEFFFWGIELCLGRIFLRGKYFGRIFLGGKYLGRITQNDSPEFEVVRYIMLLFFSYLYTRFRFNKNSTYSFC